MGSERTRDHDLEVQFLEAAAREAGISGQAVESYTRSVMARLHKGGEEYGENAFWEPAEGDVSGAPKVIREAREEAEDIGGWCLGAMQVVWTDEREGRIDSEYGHAIRLQLLQATAVGIKAFVHLENAAEMYREGISQKPLPRQSRD